MANEFVSFEKLKLFLENIKTKITNPLSIRISSLEKSHGGGGGTSSSFEPRSDENQNRPDISKDKYWKCVGFGDGINTFPNIHEDYPSVPNGSALPNCTGYAQGRLFEIIDQTEAEEYAVFTRGNAEQIYDQYSENERGQIPKLGAVMCWKNRSDGYGHVAIVEVMNKVGDHYQIIASESMYPRDESQIKKRWYMVSTYEYSNGGYYNDMISSSAYEFQGFVYAVTIPETPIQDLATVAYTGEYSDLLNTPTIPSLDNYYTKTEINNETINTNNTSTATSKHYKAPGSLTIGTRASNSIVGLRSASFGQNNEASGASSHAEGDSVKASGSVSHAEGYGTIANSVMQHVEGRLNIEDSNDLWQHISGNGNGEDKSNSYTRDWNGNGYYAGDVYGDVTWNDDGTINTKKKLAYDESFNDYLPLTGGQVNGVVQLGGTSPAIEFINGLGEINGHAGSAGTPFHNMKNPIDLKDGANKEYVDNGDEWQSAKGEIGYSGVCTAYAAIMYRKHGNNKIDISCRYTVNDVANASGFNVFDISKMASLVGVNNIVTSVGITRISAFSSADGHALGFGTYSGYAGLSLSTSTSTNSWQIYRWNNTTLDGGGGWAISSLINSPYKFYGTFDIYGATYT